MTLEDVWRILHISIHGERVVYDQKISIAFLCEFYECGEHDLGIKGLYEIKWDHLRQEYDELTIVMCSLIAGLLVLDQRCHEFHVGLGRVLKGMIGKSHVYA